MSREFAVADDDGFASISDGDSDGGGGGGGGGVGGVALDADVAHRGAVLEATYLVRTAPCFSLFEFMSIAFDEFLCVLDLFVYFFFQQRPHH